MPLEIKDLDIGYAEEILFGQRGVFDAERITFIKNLTTIDLQAVPGSGKTTALLAKLLIIEKALPFKDGSGILVLSHTNAAINEIKNKIGRFCPKLFAYPNFIGTIQSFVDQFLAIPFAHNFLGTRLRWIDTDRYQDLLWKKFQSIAWSKEYDRPGTYFWGKHIEQCRKEAKQNENEAKKLCNQKIEQEIKDLFIDPRDDKIKTFYGKKTILKDSTNKKYCGIQKIIDEIVCGETISYECAYSFAYAYIQKAPIIKRLIRKRFKFVFVDEMQDMERHQYDLLEDLFSSNEVVYQRIGDKNQAIYSRTVSLEKIWIDRGEVLTLEGSPRLSPKVAQVVNGFALDNAFKINGKGDSDISPCMIVFSDDCIDGVLPAFVELIRAKIPEKIISASKHPIRCIGWRKEGNAGNLGIKSYCADFEPKKTSLKTYYPSLMSYLVSWSLLRKDNPLNAARKHILEALITVLREEEVLQNNGKYFNGQSLLRYLKEEHKVFYSDFKLKIFIWSRDLYRGRVDGVMEDIKKYVLSLLKLFDKKIEKAARFIDGDEDAEVQECSARPNTENVYCCPDTGLRVAIGTVHSAKGETHLATLYLETFYQKKHESDRLPGCFCGQRKILSKDHEKETAKVAYVAMSRPTHLLCFAIHKDRFACIKENVSGWELLDLTSK